ncbi:uncharacterized protein PHALS_13730 [Plasmopara halstedii]|uniref:Uncharacterized protein n=1 Tax=Plasmopara halstedii TaxID=4781 RepID=A0A0P1AQQ8_PLAHL|nr:uncharacterized protein PHALS_13730 [Plasmopara halstedii]CEG43538.1 hypothetical protein PHALS_13730 [Plasmopara halstedii]|eukprot:XP_024579907.1 hypothetical protein PHALS_13730 [Plasmopara halstedii]
MRNIERHQTTISVTICRGSVVYSGRVLFHGKRRLGRSHLRPCKKQYFLFYDALNWNPELFLLVISKELTVFPWQQETTMATCKKTPKKRLSYTGSVSEEDNPSLSAEDEEVDETFVALQKLLKALNRSKRSNQGSHSSSNGSYLGSNSSAQVAPVNDIANQTRMSRDELLESRRQERECFRRSLFAKNNVRHHTHRRRTLPANYFSEEDEEEEVMAPSVESTISNRFMNGSFSAFNVHVISRDRWRTEDCVFERLPIVMLPKSGKHAIPTDNKKIYVVQTDEYIDLRDSLVRNMPNGSSTMHYLTPPRSTWYMQMHDFEALKC